MYFMDQVATKYCLQSGNHAKMDYFIGLPGIGGVSAEVYNDGFTNKSI